MPKNTPPESHLTRRNDHQLGIIRASAYSTHRAIHGSCRQAGLGIGQGVGILLPR
jgi:hypothetical protein